MNNALLQKLAIKISPFNVNIKEIREESGSHATKELYYIFFVCKCLKQRGWAGILAAFAISTCLSFSNYICALFPNWLFYIHAFQPITYINLLSFF
jgi:hypothetical protein